MKSRVLVAAWLHVVAGLFLLGCTAGLWLAAAMLAPLFEGTLVGLCSLWALLPAAPVEHQARAPRDRCFQEGRFSQ